MAALRGDISFRYLKQFFLVLKQIKMIKLLPWLLFCLSNKNTEYHLLLKHPGFIHITNTGCHFTINITSLKFNAEDPTEAIYNEVYRYLKKKLCCRHWMVAICDQYNIHVISRIIRVFICWPKQCKSNRVSVGTLVIQINIYDLSSLCQRPTKVFPSLGISCLCQNI